MKLPVIVDVSKWRPAFDPKPYRAWCPYFPDLRCDGESEEEAIKKLKDHLKDVKILEVEI